MNVHRLTKIAAACKLGLCTSAMMLHLPYSAHAGIPTVDNTETINFDTTLYGVQNQSLWSSDGPGAIRTDWSMSKSQWNSLFGGPASAALPLGGIVKECVLGVCARFGAAAGLELKAYALPYFQAELQPGTFDATASFTPTVSYQSSGLGADFVTLNTQSGLGSDNTFVVDTPSVRLDTGLNIEANLDLFAKACLIGCFLDESLNLLEVDFTLPLLQIDTIQETAVVFSPPTDFVGAAEAVVNLIANTPTSINDVIGDATNTGSSPLYSDISALLQSADIGSSGNSNSDQRPSTTALEAAEKILEESPVSVNISNPFANDVNGDGQVTGQWDGPSPVATASIGGEFLNIMLDADQLIGLAAGLPNGASLSLENFNADNPVIDASITFADLQVGPTVNLKTDVSLTPELMVELTFDAPVIMKGKVGAQTSFTGKWTDIPDIALLAQNMARDANNGNELVHTSTVTATSKFFVESTVTNRTYIDIGAAVKLEGFGGSLGIADIEEFPLKPTTFLDKSISNLASFDLLNTSFTTGAWDILSDPVGGDTPILTFEAGGEILFQARSVGQPADDIAYIDGEKDNRIAQVLSVDGLVQEEVERRAYDYRPTGYLTTLYGQSATLTTSEDVFSFNDTDVKQAAKQDFTIDNRQTAQVMRDGQLNNTNPTNVFTVEAGGTLELAADHPYDEQLYGIDNGQPGVVNEGNIVVHGDMYMNIDTLNQNDDASRFTYENSGVTTIGATGNVKIDGALNNTDTGLIDNYGSLEITGTYNESTGRIINRVGAQTDIHGIVALKSAEQLYPSRFEQPPQRVLDNQGTTTLHSGALMAVVGSEFSLEDAELNNNGELILQAASELLLFEKIGPHPGDTSLNNSFLIDNRGRLSIENTARFTNGKAGHDWRTLAESSDMVSALKKERQQALRSLTEDYQGTHQAASVAVSLAASQKQVFLSEMNQYMTDTQTTLDHRINLISSFYTGNAIHYDASVVQPQIDNFADQLRQSSLPSDPAYAMRQAEAAYGDSLREVKALRSAATELYDQIEHKLQRQADSGVGLLVNRDGGMIDNNGTLTNHSIILNEQGARFYNTERYAGAGVATLDNARGYIQNNGMLASTSTGIIDNTGTIENGSAAIRQSVGVLGMAQFVNTGVLNNSGIIENNDTLTNYGVINNQADDLIGSAVINRGVMSNLGDIENTTLLDNRQGAELNNHGTVINNGTLVNSGVLNNGQYGSGDSLSVTQAIKDADTFYNTQRTLDIQTHSLSIDNHQLQNSLSREKDFISGFLPLLPLGIDPQTDEKNRIENARRTAINNAKKEALAQTQTIRDRISRTKQRIADINDGLLALDSVDLDSMTDENGNPVAGNPFINLSRITSVNSAQLENNGTLINSGIFNNVATLTNTADGFVQNTGIMMNGEDGLIDNAGIMTLAKTNANGFEQSGMLISNGTINNTDRIEISSGMLANGTVEGTVSAMNNSGEIVLSAKAALETTATLVNQGTFNNKSKATLLIGTDIELSAQEGLGSANTFINTGTVNNFSRGGIFNYGELINTGLIDNAKDALFVSNGTLYNAETGEIRLAKDTTLAGFTLNDGLITLSDETLLTLTGDISGSGTFAGNVLLQGDSALDENGMYSTTVNPGNSPGLLTFDGDVISQNVAWVMDIWGTERGFSYDGVDITGDFTLLDGFSLSILSLLDFDAMLGQEFTFFSVSGDLIDALGQVMTASFEFLDFSDDMGDSWAGTWVNTGSSWDLNLSFIDINTDLYADLADFNIDIQSRLGLPTSVSGPNTFLLLLLGAACVILSRRQVK